MGWASFPPRLGMWYPDTWISKLFWLSIIQKNSAMATLGLKEIGKYIWEGREKGLPCWLSQFSLENTKKVVWYYEKWVGRHVSFPP